MSIKIYHNPKCSKSRKTLELIKETGEEPEVIEYLDKPLTISEITNLLNDLGLEPRDAMRHKEAPYTENNLADPSVTRDTLIATMAEYPILIERPIVITAKGACICRPPELVQDIL